MIVRVPSVLVVNFKYLNKCRFLYPIGGVMAKPLPSLGESVSWDTFINEKKGRKNCLREKRENIAQMNWKDSMILDALSQTSVLIVQMGIGVYIVFRAESCREEKFFRKENMSLPQGFGLMVGINIDLASTDPPPEALQLEATSPADLCALSEALEGMLL